MGSRKESQGFDWKLYRRLARAIHDAFCEDEDWCNYGQEPPAELRDEEGLTTDERQARARLRLEWMRHCDISVEAENIAARVQFGKGSKVRK